MAHHGMMHRMCISESCQDLVHGQVLLLFGWIRQIGTVRGACDTCSRTIRHCCHHVGDVCSAQGLLTSLAPAVRHSQGRGEVTNAKCSRIHCLTACVGCKGQVGGNPCDGGNEPSNTGCTTSWRIVWAPDAIILNGLVEENHGLAEVSSPLNHIDHTLCADPRKLFWLRVVEEVIEIPQRLLQFQGLGMLHNLFNSRNLLPLLDSGHIEVLGLKQGLG
eukprot:Skav218803  [mRNA]  locus=scaffold1140:314077:315435:- [translate_table: standard]